MADHGDELGLVEMIRILGRFRRLIFGVTGASVVLAFFLAIFATPIYRSEVLVVPSDEGSSGNSLSSIISGVPNFAGFNMFGNRGGGQAAEGIAILRSPEFTIEFIDENNLLPVLFADKWDAEEGDWDVEEPGQIPSALDGYARFHNDVRRVSEQDDGIVALSIEWNDPQMCADWSNALIDKLNLRMRQRAIDEADRTIEFLQTEVEKTNIVEIQQAIYSMMENQLNTRTVASVREEYAFRIISPALPSDADKFVKPRRAFIVVLGALIGVALGVFLSFLIYGFQRIRLEMT